MGTKLYEKKVQLILTHWYFWVNIFSVHMLICIAFAVFEYLDTALATENKILSFSRYVLPHNTRSSSANFVLHLFLCGHTN